MKLVAVLIWYDEDPQLLYETVTRLGRIPVDALVALDGAYDLYPGGQARRRLRTTRPSATLPARSA